MEFNLKELLDISKLHELLDSLEEIQKIPSAILDKEGNILTATAWQDICTKFHRVNPDVEKQCKKSDRFIESKLDELQPLVVYRCPMGLIDAAMPIIIDGKHLGNVYVGQLFTDSPDEENFINQARKYAFDEHDYLADMRKVPIIPEEKLRKDLSFIHSLTQILAEQGWQFKRQQEVEKSLREAEWKFRALFDNGPIGVAYHAMIYDETGNAVDYYFLDANEKYLELTGVDPRGKTVTQAFPGIEKDPFDWIGTFGRVAREGQTIRFEQYLEVNDRWYDCVAYQFRPDHFIAAFQEITERKKATEELLSYRDNLQALVKEQTLKLKEAQVELLQQERLAALGQLTATVSHELRNPLGTIKSALFAIDDCIEKNEPYRARRPLELAERNIDRCVNIIEELNSYARVKGLDIAESNLNNWLKATLDEIPLPEDLRTELDLACDLKVCFDQEKLRQVIVNLVNNASHALQDDRSKGKHLLVSCRAHDELYEISIGDNGSGMSAEVKEKVFEPLFSTKGFGLGLGMVIVKNIIERHQGNIHINSEVGKGTTVTLTLPIFLAGEAVIN